MVRIKHVANRPRVSQRPQQQQQQPPEEEDQQTVFPEPSSTRWRSHAHEIRYQLTFLGKDLDAGRYIFWDGDEKFNESFKELLKGCGLYGLTVLAGEIYPEYIAEFYSGLILSQGDMVARGKYDEDILLWRVNGKEYKTTSKRLGELLDISTKGAYHIPSVKNLFEIWNELTGMNLKNVPVENRLKANVLKSCDLRMLHHVICCCLHSRQTSLSWLSLKDMVLLHWIISGKEIDFAAMVVRGIKASARRNVMSHGRVITKLMLSENAFCRTTAIADSPPGVYTGKNWRKMRMKKKAGGWVWKAEHVKEVKKDWRAYLEETHMPYNPREVERVLGVREEYAADEDVDAEANADIECMGDDASRHEEMDGGDYEQRTKRRHEEGPREESGRVPDSEMLNIQTQLNTLREEMTAQYLETQALLRCILQNQKVIMEAQGLPYQGPSPPMPDGGAEMADEVVDLGGSSEPSTSARAKQTTRRVSGPEDPLESIPEDDPLLQPSAETRTYESKWKRAAKQGQKKSSTNVVPEPKGPKSCITELEQRFDNWLKTNDAMDFGFVNGRPKWMRTLVDNQQWLEEGHIDSCMWMLREKQKKKNASSRAKYAICNSHLAYNLISKYEEMQTQKTVIDFDPTDMAYNEVLGLIGNSTVPWSECEGALLPVNIENVHWVAVALNFMEQKVHVYNSLKGPKIREQLQAISTMIPRLLNAVDFYAQSRPQRELDQDWPVQVEETPKQKRDGDCGVFCINFIEHLAFGIMQVRSEEIDNFRRKLGLMLFGIAKNVPKQ